MRYVLATSVIAWLIATAMNSVPSEKQKMMEEIEKQNHELKVSTGEL